jgi:hypothetical protein
MSTTQRYLSRAETAEYLASIGLPTAKTTLQKYATVGGGPQYRRYGNKAVYLQSDLDAWVASKLSAPLASTSTSEGAH